jgi:hypothetical protein
MPWKHGSSALTATHSSAFHAGILHLSSLRFQVFRYKLQSTAHLTVQCDRNVRTTTHHSNLQHSYFFSSSACKRALLFSASFAFRRCSIACRAKSQQKPCEQRGKSANTNQVLKAGLNMLMTCFASQHLKSTSTKLCFDAMFTAPDPLAATVETL